jgi:adenosylcobinamide-GDP ribazoletransferase
VTRGLRAALVFLTRLPVGRGLEHRDFRWAPAFFPLAGAVIGGISALAWRAGAGAGYTVAAVLAVAASALVTGALHEDGLADTADALGGARDRDELFRILKDSRNGSFGTAAIAISVLLRVALIARLGALAPPALVLVHACARTPPIWLMAALPYATPAGVRRSGAVAEVGRGQVVVAAVWPAALTSGSVATGWLGSGDALALLAVGAAIATVCGWRFMARAGGYTGDFLGATEQLCEAAMLLALTL